MSNKHLLFFLLISVPFIVGFSQTAVLPGANDSISIGITDSISLQDSRLQLPETTVDNIINDTVQTDPKKSNQLNSQIIYSSKDSIVFWRNGTGFLHGEGDVKYENITLKADYIRVKMDSSLLYAKGTIDSIGDVIGEPIFGEGQTEYNSKEITYNLQTGKGYVLSAVTQQGEGYIVSERTKKTGDDLLTVGDAKFTTCDDHDHPHFYLGIKEGKVKPGSYIVSGQAQLVVADVPLPLIIPFGFFPFTSQYSSGILMPSITDDYNRGFGLVNGGYYLAINDYIDLELRGEIYTKGTWGVSAISTYLKKYRYNGHFNFSYREDVTGEKEMPDYSKMKNMSIQWSHSQDTKANPYRTFSANVNFSTSGYDRNNINSYYNPEVNSQNTKASSINFSQRFAKAPLLNISGGVGIEQRTRDSTIYLKLPDISISYSRFYPLKRKNAVGKERWYEKIYMSYSGSLTNSINTKENKLFSSSFSKDWKNGMTHNIPVSASFNVLNYITVTPSFNYSERWNLSSIRKNYDSNTEQVVIDTVSGFHRNFNFNTGVSAQTKLYGYYIPIRSIFGDKVDRIRHVVTPMIGFNYSPDFADKRWGFYDEYVRTDAYGQMDTVRYSIYEGVGVGGPGSGKTGNINFSLSNNLEMKLRNDKDTTGNEPFRKISLIDQLSISGGYNLMADSLKWNMFNVSLRLKLGKNRNLSLSGQFDPYMYDTLPNGRPVRVNKLYWNNGKFPSFQGTNISHTININNATFKKIAQWLRGDGQLTGGNENTNLNFETADLNTDGENNQEAEKKLSGKKKKADMDSDGYEQIKIPWNLNFTYSLNYRRSGDFDKNKMNYKMKLTHDLRVSGNITLTENWRINASLYYDLTEKKISATSLRFERKLHCWSMTADIVPYGVYKSYHFRIGVNASMLEDLKWEKRNNHNSSSNINWY